MYACMHVCRPMYVYIGLRDDTHFCVYGHVDIIMAISRSQKDDLGLIVSLEIQKYVTGYLTIPFFVESSRISLTNSAIPLYSIILFCIYVAT